LVRRKDHPNLQPNGDGFVGEADGKKQDSMAAKPTAKPVLPFRMQIFSLGCKYQVFWDTLWNET